MGYAYDSRRSDYFDELTVRQETARVFDVCLSCRKCVDFCSVFPSLFENVENCVDIEASLLPPNSQDEIVSQCYHCGQCSSVCPYINKPFGQAVNFPALVIRHQAMLGRNDFFFLRKRITDLIIARGLVIASWGGAGRVFGGWLLVQITKGRLPFIALQKGVRKQKRQQQRNLISDPGQERTEVIVFPTCIVNSYTPQVTNSILGVFSEVGINCSNVLGGLCCGAPDLLNGNVKRFRKIVAKNIALFSTAFRQGQPVVIGQSGCLGVMREHYESFSDDLNIGEVVKNLHDPFEFLQQVLVESGQKITLKKEPNLRIAQLNSSIDPSNSVYEVFGQLGCDVQVVNHALVAQTIWDLHPNRVPTVKLALNEVVSQVGATVDSDPTIQVIGELVLTNHLVAVATNRSIQHPMEVLDALFK